MDFGQAAVLRVAQGADPRHDIEAKLMLRQGQAALGFGAVGAAEVRTGSVETAPDLQGKM
jgi:hypothetical protein